MNNVDAFKSGNVEEIPQLEPREQVKLVIWDLDETLWKGTLSEEGVELSDVNVTIVRTLNRRGIINSICSKYGQGLYRLKGTDFVVPYGQYYEDITDPGNWSGLVSAGLTQDFLEWFSGEFEFCGVVTIERFRENIRWLSRTVPDGRTLLLIDGGEVDVSDPAGEQPSMAIHQRLYKRRSMNSCLSCRTCAFATCVSSFARPTISGSMTGTTHVKSTAASLIHWRSRRNPSSEWWNVVGWRRRRTTCFDYVRLPTC